MVITEVSPMSALTTEASRARGGEALARLSAGTWPAPATVIDLYGSWAAARADASADN